jgi:putative DNA primase/helicase
LKIVDLHKALDQGNRKKGKKRRSGSFVPSAQRDGLPPESGTDPHRLATRYLHREGHDHLGRLTLRHWRGEWWRYVDGRYIRLDERTIHHDLTATIKWIFDHEPVIDKNGMVLRVNKGIVANTLNAVASLTEVDEIVRQPAWLGDGEDRQFFAMTNELIDRDALLMGEVVAAPPTPEWFSPTQFPYAFDQAAECPRWEAFLGEVLEGDQERIALLQEFFGYCLVFDTSQHKFLVLEGEGANGKSVALEVLTHLVGPENVSNVPLEAFGVRFQLASTLGKLVNIATEVGDTDRPSEAVLKQFTSGDRMHFDRKHISPVEDYPSARLVMAANNRPRFSDGSGGLWRRMAIVPFRVVIPPDKQDKQLVQKLVAELPGVFNWAIDGLRRLNTQGGFTEPALCQEALEDYRLEANPARTFLTDHCQADPSSVVRVDNLYGSYRHWCQIHGYQPLNSSQFGKEVRRVFQGVRRVRLTLPGGRLWAYEGVSEVSHGSLGFLSSAAEEEVEIEKK